MAQGGSLQLWRAFLGDQCRIVGIDLMPDAERLAGPDAEIIIGDQGDPALLRRLIDRVGPIDILIDDGSHQAAHQLLSFRTLFPALRDGGVYVCEDLHTSYWEGWGGGLRRPGTFIEQLKIMIDEMHAPYSGMAVPADSLARFIGACLIADSIAVLRKAAPAENYMVQVGRDDTDDIQ